MSTSPVGGTSPRLPAPQPLLKDNRSLSEGQTHPIPEGDAGGELQLPTGLSKDTVELSTPSHQLKLEQGELSSPPGTLGKSPGSTRSTSAPSPGPKKRVKTPSGKKTPTYEPSGPPVGLLVEDESLQRKLQKGVLQNTLRVPFDTAETFDEAQQKLNAYHYQLLVTDHNLSADKDGTPSRTAYNQKRAELFPGGLDPNYAEGSVLLRLANLLPAHLKPKATLLISKPAGITEDALDNYARSQGAHFQPKPIESSKIFGLFQPILSALSGSGTGSPGAGTVPTHPEGSTLKRETNERKVEADETGGTDDETKLKGSASGKDLAAIREEDVTKADDEAAMLEFAKALSMGMVPARLDAATSSGVAAARKSPFEGDPNEGVPTGDAGKPSHTGEYPHD